MNNKFVLVIASLLCLIAVSSVAEEPDREQLTRDGLFSTANSPDSPVANHHFMPIDGAAPHHQFSGAITIPEHAMRTEPEAIRPADIRGRKTQLFPGVSLRFVSHGEYLVPVERDIIAPPDSDSYWHFHAGPGRVWSEESDDGMSRASFPFFLTNLFENETYNGIATFLYDDDSVSPIRYQIVQQLSPFMVETKFIAWGQQAITYQPQDIAAGRLLADFDKEIADRLDWREWSRLQSTHGAEILADFDTGIDPSLVVTGGLVIDGAVYVHSMATPYGDYPYPREMRHGVWSVTKTLTGLVTLMRLAEMYGDEILDYKIKDYVHVTADHDGWEEVTLRHAMSMATGIGPGTTNLNPNYFSDGNYDVDTDDYIDWMFAPTAQEKLDFLFKVPNYPWGPGEVARYRDRDIFVGAATLDSLYRSKEGDDADLWQMMLDEVYGPIGVHHLPKSRTFETDRPGVPLLAWGVYVTIDDVAKIAGLIENRGLHNGVQLLSAAGLSEALYDSDVRGLPTGASNRYGTNTYYLTVWHENYSTESGTTWTIPTMSGYGGNVVKLMPNGIIGFRMGNGGSKPVEQMIVIADRILPFDKYSRNFGYEMPVGKN
jgi:CubicO group peptidase (beta-lactamase class C family)